MEILIILNMEYVLKEKDLFYKKKNANYNLSIILAKVSNEDIGAKCTKINKIKNLFNSIYSLLKDSESNKKTSFINTFIEIDEDLKNRYLQYNNF